MGQYHQIVNLDKREYINPHQLASGLKLWEQIANPTYGAALIILLASASNGQGGGDLVAQAGATGEFPAVIGSWRGDRIASVGDYDKDSQYDTPDGKLSGADIFDKLGDDVPGSWRDVTPAVCAVLEAELKGKFTGEGWRDFEADAA